MKSISNRAILSDKSKEKPREAVIAVDVVIPAFNEESCIEGVLYDVLMERQHDWFQIPNIYVISDAPMDQTDDIVQRVTKRDPRIKLIRKKNRKGKSDVLGHQCGCCCFSLMLM